MPFNSELSLQLVSGDPEIRGVAYQIVQELMVTNPDYLKRVNIELQGEPLFDYTKYPQALENDYVEGINYLRYLCEHGL